MVQAYTRRKQAATPSKADEKPLSELPLRRNSDEAQARRASVLLDDPRWRAAFDNARDEAIAELEATEMDGSPASEARVLERVRQLQALLRVKQIVLRPLIALHNKDGGTPA